MAAPSASSYNSTYRSTVTLPSLVDVATDFIQFGNFRFRAGFKRTWKQFRSESSTGRSRWLLQ
jgi:hypothetical protein